MACSLPHQASSWRLGSSQLWGGAVKACIFSPLFFNPSFFFHSFLIHKLEKKKAKVYFKQIVMNTSVLQVCHPRGKRSLIYCRWKQIWKKKCIKNIIALWLVGENWQFPICTCLMFGCYIYGPLLGRRLMKDIFNLIFLNMGQIGWQQQLQVQHSRWYYKHNYSVDIFFF